MTPLETFICLCPAATAAHPQRLRQVLHEHEVVDVACSTAGLGSTRRRYQPLASAGRRPGCGFMKLKRHRLESNKREKRVGLCKFGKEWPRHKALRGRFFARRLGKAWYNTNIAQDLVE